MRANSNPPTPITPACLPSSIVGSSQSGYSSARTNSQPSPYMDEVDDVTKKRVQKIIIAQGGIFSKEQS